MQWLTVTAPRQLYDDGVVQLDQEALTLRRYHFPSGTSKVIPIQAIRGYKVSSLWLWPQRFQIWGPDLLRWMPLDIRRPLKSKLITLDVPGTYPSPAFTPSDPAKFIKRFDELLAD